MMTLSQSVVVHAPRDVVFEYVTDPARLADWIPSMVEAREIVGSGAGQQYEWTYKLAGLLFRGQTVVVEYVPNELSVHQAIGAVTSIWTIQTSSHDGGTELSIKIAYDVPTPVLGRLAERVIVRRDGRNLEMALANVKDVLEAE